MKKQRLTSFLLCASLALTTLAGTIGTARPPLVFTGLTDALTTVTIADGKVTAPQALAEQLSEYSISYDGATTLDTKGWHFSTANKELIIDGFTAGDVVTITLAKNRLTTNGKTTSNLGTWKFVAQAGKESAQIIPTGSSLGLYTKDGEVVIERIDILTAEEAADRETVSKPAISNNNGVITITPGVSNKGREVTTYFTTDGSIPSSTNGIIGNSLTVATPTIVRAISVSEEAQSDVVSSICSPTAPRAHNIELSTLYTGSPLTLSSTGVAAVNYNYANQQIELLYGTLAFANPARWTISSEGLSCSADNEYFEIPNLHEGDKVKLTISSGRLQLYDQSVNNHLVDGKPPKDGYTNISKAGEYEYEVTMLTDANLKIATKESPVCLATINIEAKKIENHEMPATWSTAPQNRALWGCQTPDGNTFISWRARKTDNSATSYILYRNGSVYDTFTSKTNTTIPKTSETFANDSYRLEVKQDNAITETMELHACSVKPHSWFRLKLADEPTVTNTGTMWDKDGKDTGYSVRYTPNDMAAYDMDGDGEEELILKWDPSNSQDNGYSGYTANVYIDCYKVDWQTAEASLMWRINLGQNIRAGAHYTQFLCYDFDGDGKGEMIVKTSLGSKDGQGNYVWQNRINERGLDVNRDYTRQDDSGIAQKSNGHIGVGEEWLTVFEGATGRELASCDYYPRFNVVSSWDEPANSSNRYNKGTRFKACVAFVDGIHPSAIFNRGYYSQSFFTAYNWNGKSLYEVWRHESLQKGEGLYGQGNHSLVVADMDGDGKDEIGTGPAVLDNDGTILWSSGYGHGDAHHIGDFSPANEGLEIFYVNEEYGESPYSSALFDARTGKLLKGLPQLGMDTGRGLAANVSAAHPGAEYFTKGDRDNQGNSHIMQYTDNTPDWIGGNGNYTWLGGSLKKGFQTTDELNNTVTNDKDSYPNYRIYWDGDLLDEWMDSRHVDKWNDETRMFERLYTFDTPAHHAYSINGTKENPCLQSDLFGDWREEVVFYDYDVTESIQKTVSSKSENDGQPFTIDWDVRQYYLTVFTTTIPTEYRLPWLRDDHAYDMSIAWQNVGYNQPPHLSFSPLEAYDAIGPSTGIKNPTTTKNDIWYTLQGIRTRKPSKGIYIHDGKKTCLK